MQNQSNVIFLTDQALMSLEAVLIMLIDMKKEYLDIVLGVGTPSLNTLLGRIFIV